MTNSASKAVFKDIWIINSYLIFVLLLAPAIFVFLVYNYNAGINKLLLAFSFLSLLCASILFILNKLIMQPIRQLSLIADKVAKGEKIDKLPRSNWPEIQSLSYNLIQVQRHLNREKQHKNQIVQAREEAEQAILIAKEAKAARDEFLRKLRHELKNPLTTILGYAEIMIHEKLGAIPSRYKEAAENIFKSGYQMGTLMTNVLNRRMIHTAKVINQCIAIHKDKAYFSKIHYTSEIDSTLPKIYVDEVRFKQILVGVIHHSLTLTPSEESIHITAQIVIKKKKPYKLVIIIKDTGFGGTEAFRKHSIDAKGPQGISRNSDGTDLTIDSIRSLLALHHGTLEIDSIHGKGTTFTVIIPYLEEMDNDFIPNGKDLSKHSNVTVLFRKST